MHFSHLVCYPPLQAGIPERGDGRLTHAAIFMGGFALVILGAILGTALNAVAGIEVSYGSFNKEMVQAMSKGQKQT